MYRCTICPRKCMADRQNGEVGYCGETDKIHAARASLHMWEEPCISGTQGSGTVFFSGCSLKCVYCQNKTIALGKFGKEIGAWGLAKTFLSLQNRGAHNINLVTPTHFAHKLAKPIKLARQNGLVIPIVYNTSGYELSSTIEMLKNSVDIYLTDFKYFNPHTAKKYSNAPDYPEVAKEALKSMVNQCPKPVFDENGIMQKGVIVRVLLLPGSLQNSKDVVEYVFSEYGHSVYISLMNQYTPVDNFENYPELNFAVTKREYDKLVDFAYNIGVKNAYVQCEETAKESFIPNFDGSGLILDF